jgi:diguanylate cyclase (GGDEF)-like protein
MEMTSNMTAFLFPFIASSICLMFSVLFTITNCIFRREKAFFGFSLISFVVALNQFAVGMKTFLFPFDYSASFLWLKIQYVAMAILIFSSVYFVYLLLERKIKAPMIYATFLVSLLLIPLVFSPFFGEVGIDSEGGFIFNPKIVPFAIAAILIVVTIYCLVLLLIPYFLGKRGKKVMVYFLYAVGGLILFTFGILEISMDWGLISQVPFRLSSVGAVFWVLAGATVVLVYFYEARISLKKVMIRLSETKKELDKKVKMAINDGLTGLYNRGFFDESLNAEVQDSIENNRSLTLLMMDLDDFKAVNDTLGHLMGDYVLSEIAAIIKNNNRASDLPARYGGEEFAVILPNTNISEARMVAERIRENIEAIEFIVEGKPKTSITISVGIAPLKGSDLASDLLGRADKALYAAKKRGGNSVSVSK